MRVTSDFEHEWNHSKASGWMLKVHGGKKALFYLLPLDESFLVTLTVRPEERNHLASDAGVSEFHEALGVAKKYSEGYALKFQVSDAASFAGFATFIQRLIALRKRPTRR